MKNKLPSQTPNLKSYLFVLFLSLYLFGFGQVNPLSCGSIENFEFTNGHESVHIQDNGVYIFDDLPGHFYVKVNIHGYVQSVRYHVINIDTNETFEIIENIVPYTFPAGNADWDIGLGTFQVTASAYFQNNAQGFQCDSETITFTLGDEEPCLADAGTMSAVMPEVCSTGEVMISATANGDANVPEGYSTLYVLTSGEGLVIEQVNATPDFTVVGGGLYTIHSFVYPSDLDLSVIVPGVTTGFDVNGLLIQGGGNLCASLDVAGAPITVINPDAGTLTADESSVELSGGEAMLSATPNGDANVPDGYSTLFVLTSGEGLLIEQVNVTPDFTVTESGDYTIHTLVYPTGLDLSVVVPGVTTGFDVNGLLVQGGGELCASLDVAGAPIHVGEEPCLADAGTMSAVMPEVCSTGEVMISATANGDANVPEGYSTLYVLTSGEGLVIEQVNATPDFTVVGGGLYTIHSFVYPSDLDLSVIVPGVTTGFDVNGLLIQGGGNLCASLDVAGAPITVINPDAGTLTADESSVELSGGEAMLSATPNGDANVPDGYSTLFVLTSGEGLLIEQVNVTPDFTVTESGDYTIHTLVYPTGLDLSVVVPGVTTGFDVNGLLVQGGGELCASLDVAGAPIHVGEGSAECNAFAGTLYSYQPIQCLDGGTTTIYAEEVEAPVIPNGYQQLFVLTNAFNLTILDVSATPEFEINHVGFYRIHSLVYDPQTLDLSIVQLGDTTAFDVLPLLQQGGGEICASLDVHGAVNLVLPGWFCNFFNSYFGFGRNAQGEAVNAWLNEFNDYQSFEDAMLADFTETSVYPNPVKSELNINTLLLQDEIVGYTIVDMQGRLLKRGVISTISTDRHQIDMSNLSMGTYIVQLSSEFRNFTTKVQVN